MHRGIQVILAVERELAQAKREIRIGGLRNMQQAEIRVTGCMQALDDIGSEMRTDIANAESILESLERGE